MTNTQAKLGTGARVALGGSLLLVLGALGSWAGINVLGEAGIQALSFGDWTTVDREWEQHVMLLLGVLALGVAALPFFRETVLPANQSARLLGSVALVGLLGVLLFIHSLPELTQPDHARLLGEFEAEHPALKDQAQAAGRNVVAFSYSLGWGVWLSIVALFTLLGAQVVRNRRELGIFSAAAVILVGVNVAIHLVSIKIDLLSGGSGNAGCQAAPGFDCGSVNSSEESMLFGLPISLLALPTYALMLYLLSHAWRGGRSESTERRERGDFSLKLTLCVSLLTVAYSIYLFYVSKVVIGKLCLFCMVLYGVHAATTAFTLLATRGAIVGPVFDVASALRPVLPAVGVFIIVGGLSWLSYEDAKQSATTHVAASGLATAENEAETLDANEAVQQAERKAMRAQLKQRAEREKAEALRAAKGSTGPKASKPAALPPRSERRCKTFNLKEIERSEPPPPDKRGDGYRFFDTPIDRDCDFIAGNPDAILTVVKYADFQCQYCKRLATALTPLKEKYKDKVRFVMKQFPMNGKCNPRMSGYDKHPYACDAAYASHCAGVQGKFWEMHDLLYQHQSELNPGFIRGLATKAGLDLGAYDTCLVDPRTDSFIKQDIKIAFHAQIHGTPKTYIGNRMVSGASTSILDYHIKRALNRAESLKRELAGGAQAAAVAPVPDGTKMVRVETTEGAFFIDPYEASVGKSGEAVAFKGIEPAQASYFEAKTACEAAGKRLCSEEEWTTACTGQMAIDNNGNGWFSDDEVEGDMYPYGGFYKGGTCHDSADKYAGKAAATGSKAKCRTRSGIFDLTGNIGEWVNSDEKKATLMGGNAGSGERAACNQRSYGRGLGRKNHTTGFRCCADTQIARKSMTEADLKKDDGNLVQRPVPAFNVVDQAGKKWSNTNLKGKVTLVNFFASWCGPCKKEFPYLVKYVKELGPKGFQILALGQDTQAESTYTFAKGFNANFPVAHDADSKMMGLFRVYSMPTTFLVDRKGIVRYMDTGFKPSEQAAKLRAAIERLL